MQDDFQSFYQNILREELSGVLPEAILREYAILSCLKHEPSGEMYLMRRLSDERKCILRVSGTHSDDVTSEYSVLSRLDHRCIPKAFGLWEIDGKVFFMREYFDGQTLMQYVKAHGALGRGEILDIAIRISDILVYLHSQTPPVIHRDIKPENVILTESDEIRLIDFGIARAYREDATSDTIAIGTRPYMAPEQFGGAQTDARTDLYALGTLMIYLGTARTDRTNLSQRYPYRDLLGIIREATEIDPNARPQTAKQMRKRLQFIRQGGRRRVLRILGVAAVVLALAVGSYLFGQRMGEYRGYYLGQTQGYESGRQIGYQSGYDQGASDTEADARASSYKEGQSIGYNLGYHEGLQEGYDSGLAHAQTMSRLGYDPLYEQYFPDTLDYGNTGSNYNNDGLAVAHEKHIYLCLNGAIYRSDPQLENLEVFYPAPSRYLNIVDNHLYFISGSFICRMPLEGGDVEELLRCAPDKLIAADGRLYYTNGYDSLNLYTVELDGTNAKRLNDIETTYYLNIAGEHIYFVDANRNLRRARLDGSEDIILRRNNCGGVIALGDYVFFTQYGDTAEESGFFRMNRDGGDIVKLINATTNHVNITPYGVFYSDGGKNRTPARSSFDSMNSAQLSDVPCDEINVADGWLILTGVDGKTYRMWADGSQFGELAAP